jgi:hypothetical protein
MSAVRGAGAPQRRIATRQGLAEEARVVLGVDNPLFGRVVLVVDRLNGADRLAGATVDAPVRVDVGARSRSVAATAG